MDISLKGIDKYLKEEIEDFLKNNERRNYVKPRDYNSYVYNKEMLAFIRQVFVPGAARMKTIWDTEIWKGLFGQLSILTPVNSKDDSVQVRVPHSEPPWKNTDTDDLDGFKPSLQDYSGCLVVPSSSMIDGLKSNNKVTHPVKELSSPLETIDGDIILN